MDSETKTPTRDDLVVQFLPAKGTELFLTRGAGLLEGQGGGDDGTPSFKLGSKESRRGNDLLTGIRGHLQPSLGPWEEHRPSIQTVDGVPGAQRTGAHKRPGYCLVTSGERHLSVVAFA